MNSVRIWIVAILTLTGVSTSPAAAEEISGSIIDVVNAFADAGSILELVGGASSCEAATPAPITGDACPVYLDRLHDEDDKGRGELRWDPRTWGKVFDPASWVHGKGAAEACSGIIGDYTSFKTPEDFEAHLSKWIVGNSSRGSIRINQSCLYANGAKHRTRKQEHFLIAEYYYVMDRLRRGSFAALESTAALDRLLGNPVLDELDCSRSILPDFQFACEKLKGCPDQHRNSFVRSDPVCLGAGSTTDCHTPGPAFDELAEQTRQALEGYRQFKAEASNIKDTIRRQKSEYILSGMPPHDPQMVALFESEKQIDAAMQVQLEVVHHLFPWTNGKQFGKRFDVDKKRGDLRAAMYEQFAATRKANFDKLRSFQNAASCVSSPSGNCGEDFEDIVMQAPEDPRITTRDRAILDDPAISKADKMAHIETYGNLGVAACKYPVRQVKREVASTVKEGAKDAAITLSVTALSALAPPAGAALVASDAAVAARLTTVARALGFAGRGVTYAAGGANMLLSASSAYQECRRHMNKLVTFDGGYSGGDIPACPSGMSAGSSNLESDTKKCLVAVALTGHDLLPFLPVVVRKLVLKNMTAGAQALAMNGARQSKATLAAGRRLAKSADDVSGEDLADAAETLVSEVEGIITSEVENKVVKTTDSDSDRRHTGTEAGGKSQQSGGGGGKRH